MSPLFLLFPIEFIIHLMIILDRHTSYNVNDLTNTFNTLLFTVDCVST
jgi:hypothetical protein